ncbi:hypothetical protein NEHOM01_1494 [Nematocida homosporus]|uniref:uncharacterized protein n=1 Tax=Nematocida homosporus TaxID=1912981 RepID=UPI00221F013E|nr:uncharacterized protein NEHOM01_1494 [Nematocida homosporus]KAI5186482.1 hypothetical protein NEHOM01_1494 [Nematocida homosporus]
MLRINSTKAMARWAILMIVITGFPLYQLSDFRQLQAQKPIWHASLVAILHPHPATDTNQNELEYTCKQTVRARSNRNYVQIIISNHTVQLMFDQNTTLDQFRNINSSLQEISSIVLNNLIVPEFSIRGSPEQNQVLLYTILILRARRVSIIDKQPTAITESDLSNCSQATRSLLSQRQTNLNPPRDHYSIGHLRLYSNYTTTIYFFCVFEYLPLFKTIKIYNSYKCLDDNDFKTAQNINLVDGWIPSISNRNEGPTSYPLYFPRLEADSGTIWRVFAVYDRPNQDMCPFVLEIDLQRLVDESLYKSPQLGKRKLRNERAVDKFDINTICNASKYSLIILKYNLSQSQSAADVMSCIVPVLNKLATYNIQIRLDGLNFDMDYHTNTIHTWVDRRKVGQNFYSSYPVIQGDPIEIMLASLEVSNISAGALIYLANNLIPAAGSLTIKVVDRFRAKDPKGFIFMAQLIVSIQSYSKKTVISNSSNKIKLNFNDLLLSCPALTEDEIVEMYQLAQASPVITIYTAEELIEDWNNAYEQNNDMLDFIHMLFYLCSSVCSDQQSSSNLGTIKSVIKAGFYAYWKRFSDISSSIEKSTGRCFILKCSYTQAVDELDKHLKKVQLITSPESLFGSTACIQFNLDHQNQYGLIELISRLVGFFLDQNFSIGQLRFRGIISGHNWNLLHQAIMQTYTPKYRGILIPKTTIHFDFIDVSGQATYSHTLRPSGLN